MLWYVEVHDCVCSRPVRYIHEAAADPRGGTPKAQKVKEAGGLAKWSERENGNCFRNGSEGMDERREAWGWMNLIVRVW